MIILDGHKKLIYKYMLRNGSITGRDAYGKLQINDFTARISDIRKIGIPVLDEWKVKKNSKGEEKRFKLYFLGDISGVEIKLA